ncbi:MAG TPA: MetQ/NlpA family ABC transporter substrate-binding protein [Clostridia bacterium]|nr:MetQ/NlpA family ABC transporter substrate-binding protein [Clostridia bacterium]
MKKFLSVLFAALLALSLFAGCAQPVEAPEATAAPTEAAATEAPSTEEPATEAPLTVIKVGASITPHAEILAQVKEDLAAQGYDLQVVEFTDYVQPNLALESGELDANYFQPQPYLDEFNAQNGTHIVTVAAIHYEPFGIYPGKTKTLAEIQDGAQIAVPNDGTNEARALLLLEAQGLIKLKEDAGLNATALDVVENPKNIKIIEVEAAQLARSLQDVDFAVINGNYAIQAGLNVAKDAVATEDKDSVAADTYANIVCVKEGNEQNPGVLALIAALQTDTIRTFIETTYEGAVVPKF